jgi:hypothetical protein
MLFHLFFFFSVSFFYLEAKRITLPLKYFYVPMQLALLPWCPRDGPELAVPAANPCGFLVV